MKTLYSQSGKPSGKFFVEVLKFPIKIIKISIIKWLTAYRKKIQEVILARIRIGHTYSLTLNSWNENLPHLLNLEIFSTPLTTQHIFQQCPLHPSIRNETDNPSHVIQCLKNYNLYKLILYNLDNTSVIKIKWVAIYSWQMVNVNHRQKIKILQKIIFIVKWTNNVNISTQENWKVPSFSAFSNERIYWMYPRSEINPFSLQEFFLLNHIFRLLIHSTINVLYYSIFFFSVYQ